MWISRLGKSRIRPNTWKTQNISFFSVCWMYIGISLCGCVRGRISCNQAFPSSKKCIPTIRILFCLDGHNKQMYGYLKNLGFDRKSGLHINILFCMLEAVPNTLIFSISYGVHGGNLFVGSLTLLSSLFGREPGV